MGIKAFNHGNDFVNKFVRAVASDSTGLDAVTPRPGPILSGLTATGGVISDYTDPGSGDVYRAHVFTSSGTFDVTAVGSLPTAVDYLVVAGGGGGGASQAGGGGAGGLRTNLSGHPLSTNNPGFPVASGVTYPVTIGSGGAGNNTTNTGSNGIPSVLTHPDANLVITALGGGGGGSWRPGNPSSVAGNGGSGGGAGRYNGPTTGGSGSFSGSPANPQPYRQGYPGGFAQPGYSAPYSGGGGGGAGGAGTGVENDMIGTGGLGVQVLIAGPPTHTGVGATGPSSPYGQWFAGGGGAGNNIPGTSGVRAGGGGAPLGFSLAGGGIGHGRTTPEDATSGSSGTGGGGGGGSHPGTSDGGASGGSGIVIVRYKIAEITAVAKATGGAISFYGDKTIHTFTSSGTFTVTDGALNSVDYVAVAGGGGSGIYAGGGAGGYLVSSLTTSTSPGAYTINIGSGGGEAQPFNGVVSPAGSPTTISNPNITTVTASGGGGAASNNVTGGPGGSGGGGGYGGLSGGVGNRETGTTNPAPSQGYPGGAGSSGPPNYGGGGGGGAGGAGGAGTPTVGGLGGIGIQMPSVFHDPLSTVGSPGPTATNVSGGTSGKFWVAGGGGGGTYQGGSGSAGGGSGGPYAGGGDGKPGTSNTKGDDGTQNTGGGAGATGFNSDYAGGASGGSGIVLIAYPS